ncbi:MAG TPA: phosphate ABC transporter substrate-binding protein PstS [Solirubrobacteraceae bacterium]|nr:phosphate ABC transporter substrate-binding protein PstS [Solirubrobacteraceae bacterium]
MRHLAAKLAVFGAAAAVVLGTGVSSASASFSLKGAGSTLIQPMLANVWIPDFQSANSGDTVSYPGGGSTAGINDITANDVNFGASDAPMTSAQLSACGANCKQIPWALSATGPVYNISGVSSLNLSGPVLAGIYSGTITTWDDPAIKKINPGVALPSATIAVFWRSDGSGDTFVFESFLADTDSSYKSFLGTAGPTTTSNFPDKTGTGEKSNSGVATAVSNTPDSIGYVSTFYAHDAQLHGASVENASGKFVHPYPQDMTDAANLVPASALSSSNYNTEPVIANYVAAKGYHAKKLKKGQKAPKVSKAQKALQTDELGAYPLSTFTDVLVRSDGPDVPDLQKFILFCLSPAEQSESKTGSQSFAPLPSAVVKFDTAQVNAL